jgi:hypothetical protein
MVLIGMLSPRSTFLHITTDYVKTLYPRCITKSFTCDERDGWVDVSRGIEQFGATVVEELLYNIETQNTVRENILVALCLVENKYRPSGINTHTSGKK